MKKYVRSIPFSQKYLMI